MERAALGEASYLKREIRKQLEGDAEQFRQVELLESIFGVGIFSALLFCLELWDITRFRDAAHLGSYIGFVPSTHRMGEVLWNGRMTRQGNAFVRWIFVQNAWVAARTDMFFRNLYERHQVKKKKGRAIIPVARALSSAIHRVWTEVKSYPEIYGLKASVG